MIKFIPIGTRNEKGKALERIFGSALANLGYTDLSYNVHTTGEEIDIEGIHKVSRHPIKCECKAHANPIGSNDLQKFFGNLSKEIRSKKHLTGLFISASGFNGTANRWYGELDDLDKEFFKIIDDKNLFSILNESKLVCSEDKLKYSVSMKTQIPFYESALILSDRGLFWEVTLEDDNTGEIYYMLLDNSGDSVKIGDRDYLISKPPLSSNDYVSLEIKEKILIKLLEMGNLTINDLISELDEPEVEIRATIANLNAEQIVENSSREIVLREEIESFLALTKYFKDSNDILIFMASDFFKNNSESLIIPYIESKFKLRLDDSEKIVVFKLISISPKALFRCLFGDSTRYKNNAEHLDQLKLDASEREKHEKETRTGFITSLSRDLMIDIELNNNKKLLLDNEIVLVVTSTEIHLSKEFKRFIGVTEDKSFLSFIEAGGSIKAGQLLTVTAPGPLFKIASALTALEYFDEAIKEYDSIIEGWPNHEDLSVAIHNKGAAYLQQEMYNEALNELEKVRFNEKVRPNVLMNLCDCYFNLKLEKPLQNALYALSKNWPEEAKNLKNSLNAGTGI